MTELPREGAGRPLYESAPKIQLAVPAAPYLWGAVVSYPLAYLYVKEILFARRFAGWGLPVFTVLFVAGVEAMARALHRRAAAETPLWAGCWLVLAGAMAFWGEQPVLGSWQPLVWHIFAVWFVLARCGMLAHGYSGSLCFLDGLTGFVVLPFGNFFRRIGTVWAGVRNMGRQRRKLRGTAVGAVTVLVTLLLCAMAWNLLAAADPHFAALGRAWNNWLSFLLNSEKLVSYIVYFMLSLPVGAWLYGLVAGSLRRETPPCPADRFYAGLEPFRLLPRVTAIAAVGALCAIYTLFFGLQAAEWLAAAPLGLTAPAASDFAVDGFWELLRILLLDFCVLAAVRFLGRRPLPKTLAALFCLYGIAFALLAGAKLAVYIHLFGYTPRRVVAGWFLGVLAVWAVLLLVRVFRSIPAARMGLAVLAVTFVLLSCVDMKSRIVRANLDRYAAGVDADLDLDVLQDCGLNYWTRGREQADVVTYTRWLLDAGWFENRSIEDLQQLYDMDGPGLGETRRVQLNGNWLLTMTFDDRWCCTAASLTQTENRV